jgi:dihydroorotate dehydrogenase
MYPLLRQLLFNFPPEDVHHFSMNLFRDINKLGIASDFLSKQFRIQHPALRKQVFGLNFQNPVGLGAGFDKNARYLDELAVLGFGFVEVGTVTPVAQPGNDAPRVFRLPADQALINRMGFNNDGAKVIRQRLENWRTRSKHPALIVGGNIGKNKVTPNENAWRDYDTCFRELFDCVDYFVVNVSSPNTPGLRALQEKDSLNRILGNLQEINAGKRKRKPLLLKIAPDLTQEQLDDIIALSFDVKLDGLVATNTTTSRAKLRSDKNLVASIGDGGLSGRPLRERSTEVVQYISSQANGSIPVIASGGIFTGTDAVEKMAAGASLVQVWTGFIYEGPSIVKNICNYLITHSQHHY